MNKVSRRDLLKTGLLAPAAVAVANGMGPMGLAMQAGGNAPEPLPSSAATASDALPGAGRERLLLDFGWRFHFGNADDPAKDFGFGTGGPATSRRRETSCRRARWPLTTATGRALICRMTGRSSCPSRTIPSLSSKGFYPLGRNYPETSVGWYRRVFELPAADKGKRITLEFDGAYRETMVVFNGFYIGTPQRRLRSIPASM